VNKRKEKKADTTQIGEGEKETNLAVCRDGPSPAREKKGRAGGQLLAGLGQGGAAPKPLDGGVLTRWGARAPARGPATAPWLPRSTAFARSWSLLVALRKKDRAKREKGKEANEARVFQPTRPSGF